ncbi:tetratricopeptide repeat protein [Flavobacterium sp. 3HN19-14]|uniref:ATP-binding protein n=1 Tax=Flavobacterium sp. 3HN19-14 TaxID=3448133 RepID=UPI003EE295F4
MKKSHFILVFLLILSLCNAQDKKQIDSLYKVVRTAKNDSIRFIAYNKIAFHYTFNDVKKAKEILDTAEKAALKANSKFGYAKLINTHGILMDVVGKSDSAEYYFSKALTLSQQSKFTELESFCINNLGMFYWNKGNFNQALVYFFKALKISEKTDTNGEHVAINLNNIGLIYQEMSLFDKALECHIKAYKLREKNKSMKELSGSLNNMGYCYKNLGQLDLAISTYKKGLKVAAESRNDIVYAKILDNLGNAYFIKKQYSESIKAYLEALKVVDKNTESDRSRLIVFSGSSASYNALNQPKVALNYANKALAILKKNPNYRSFSEELFLSAAQSSYQLGDYEKGKKFTDAFISLKDSLFSKNNARAIADLEVKYETEKKEHELASSRAIVAERELEIKRKNSQFIYLAIACLVFILIGYLFYNQQKLKNRQLKKENELRAAMSKIETQNHLQQQRLQISRDLHDNIGAQLTFIISTIDTLKLLDIPKEKLNQKLNAVSEFTVDTIYELRDTIWAMNKNDITFDDLKTRITNFINSAKSSQEHIDFEFSIEGNTNEKPLSSIDGMNIYRIIQESVNNALKYAEAKKIAVAIVKKSNSINIEITDDGKGFDTENAESGNGLNNMQKRAKELKASVKVTSENGKGTRVLLEMPV